MNGPLTLEPCVQTCRRKLPRLSSKRCKKRNKLGMTTYESSRKRLQRASGMLPPRTVSGRSAQSE